MLQLKAFNCTKCGGSLDFAADGLRAVCKYCGTEHFFKEDKAEALIMLLNEAGEYLKKNLFDDAIAKHTAILSRYPEDSEAAWGLAVSTYGIVYARDERTGKMIPTCSRIAKGSILDFPAYKTAIENCADEQRALYESEAQFIDKLQRKIKRAMEDEEDFDVFISFKATDESGRGTEDAYIARQIYDELTKRGLKVFFSEVTLSGRIGDEYEPIIYRALYSCKFFIFVTTSESYIEAPWVKNEWTRFRDRMDEENLTGVSTAVYKNIKPYVLPKFLQAQGVDIEKHPFDYQLIIADSLSKKFGLASSEPVGNDDLQRKMRELEEKLRMTQEVAQPVAVDESEDGGEEPDVVGNEGVKYALSKDGSYALVKTCSKNVYGDVAIAPKFAGKPVTKISAGAFSNCENIESVTIPDTVTAIGKSAFEYCKGLTAVTIPEGVTSIGESAFYDCRALGEISVPSSVKSIGEDAFSGCKALKRVGIKEGCVTIGDRAFSGCYALVEATVPSSVKTLGERAFGECPALAKIAILGSGLKTIERGAFAKCKSLQNVIYGGTTDEWKAIKINYNSTSAGLNNSLLKKVVIVCSDGQIKPGLFGKLFK